MYKKTGNHASLARYDITIVHISLERDSHILLIKAGKIISVTISGIRITSFTNVPLLCNGSPHLHLEDPHNHTQGRATRRRTQSPQLQMVRPKSLCSVYARE